MGEIVFKGEDEYGSISVIDDGDLRFLQFDTDIIQSVIHKVDADTVVSPYARYILGVMKEKSSKFGLGSTLILGLGASILSTWTYKNLDTEDLLTVELRRAVAEVATVLFDCPLAMKIVIEDALIHVAESTTKRDTIVVDLFTDTGVLKGVKTPRFLNDCLKLLNTDGTLIINSWVKDVEGKFFIPLLKRLFKSVYVHEVDGNCVIIAQK